MSPNGLGWIIVDSLDTLMIMNLTGPLAESRKWLHRSLSYDQDQDVNTFETTIRMLGGLLGAHYLANRLPDVASRRDSVYPPRLSTSPSACSRPTSRHQAFRTPACT
jgi:mannosyl-oligosaccharide alpha-1,2-mannosidase